jgi:AbiV family abortive infection protein
MRRPPPSQSVTLQYLLEGAAYALEQGGLLLHDSLLLYLNGKYASAIVMALFAREEVGRYNLLRDLRKEMVEKGRTVTVEDIRRTCDDHVAKQFRGQFGVTLKSSGDDQLGKLLRAIQDNHPQSPQAQKAHAELDSIVKGMPRKESHQRHDLRQKSLYVEPSDSGTSWNRPKYQSKQTAREEIQGAANAYAGALDRFTSVDVYRDEDPAFYSALEAWKECPTMPTAPHPPAFD